MDFFIGRNHGYIFRLSVENIITRHVGTQNADFNRLRAAGVAIVVSGVNASLKRVASLAFNRNLRRLKYPLMTAIRRYLQLSTV